MRDVCCCGIPGSRVVVGRHRKKKDLMIVVYTRDERSTPNAQAPAGHVELLLATIALVAIAPAARFTISSVSRNARSFITNRDTW